jgi:hypothetical protein|tara:strand:- start:555 stop:731 length:177 start_codon:yes stop_codon:yes gene_type:complete
MKIENLSPGTKVTYNKEYMFGKTSKETAKVIMHFQHNILLCNGDMIPKWEINRLTITK